MTDEGPDGGLSELDRVLNALKPIAEPADTPPVATPGPEPRMAWDTVVDRDPDVACDDSSALPPRAASSFLFDLGSAMTHRTDPETPTPAAEALANAAPVADAPVVVPPVAVPPLAVRRPAEPVQPARVQPAPVQPAERQPAHEQSAVVPPLESRWRVDPQVVLPLETRRPAESTQQAPAARVEPAVGPANGPVDAPSDRPTSPPLERRAPLDTREQAPPRRTVFDDEASGAARAALHRVPTGSSIAEAAGVRAMLPSLPATAPGTPSAVPSRPAAVEMPTVSDVRAYRTAQQRAAKRNSQGRLFGRVLLVIVVLGGLIGAALLFGRSYLFPTEWDPALTPLVDEIQVARNAEFVEPIDLVIQPEAEFAATFAGLFVPGGWENQLPTWRALGIAGGAPTTQSVAASLATARPALFDPASESIVQLADADADDVEAALRAALEQGFEFQRGNSPSALADEATERAVGFLGVSDPRSLVDRSLTVALGNGVALPSGEDATLPVAADVPLPVAYELAALARIGSAVAAASADAGVILAPGGDFPDSVYAVFAPPGPIATLGAVLGDGEALSAPAAALSNDDWRLVLGARVAPDVADAVATGLTANSYGTFDRAGTACFAAVFHFGDAATAQGGIDGIGAWVATLPLASQAVATPIDFTTLQVIGCDPGAADPIAVDASWADAVIDGQLARL